MVAKELIIDEFKLTELLLLMYKTQSTCNYTDIFKNLYKYLSYADDGIANLIYDQYIENINKNIFKMSKCFVIFKDMSINFKVNTKAGLQNQKINLI